MSTSTSSSSLASIVFDTEDTDMWRKLKDNKPLAKLHAKFWGKGLVQDEASGQTSDPSKREDLDIDVSMEDDTDESMEDDTKKGYVLVLDNIAFRNKRIWVRDDYIRIYEYLVKRWEDDFDNGQAIEYKRAPSTVVTGQPGIGKSVWIYYALCRCLSEKRPVVWLHKSTLYMFVEEGVYDMGTEFQKAEYKTFVWTLVDSDESESGVPENLMTHDTPFSVIYTTSPAKRRWSRMHKTTSNAVVLMNPWSRSEIHIAAALLEDRDRPGTDIINDTFDRFGPTPRICIQIASVPDDLHAYEVDVDEALDELTLERLQELTTMTRNLAMDKISHKLCLVRRNDIDDVRSDRLISPITEYIQSEIANRMQFCGMEQQVETFRILYLNTGSRAMSGTVFENIFHLRFQHHIFIRFMPMVRSDKRTNSRWHASHCAIDASVLYAQELEGKRQLALNKRDTLDASPTSYVVYDRLAFALRQNVYYVPKKLNEAALDSFILNDGLLYIFQFTVSPEHKINDQLNTLFENCFDVPSRDNWRYIFIIPDDKTVFECPYPKNRALQQLTPFSAKVSEDANP